MKYSQHCHVRSNPSKPRSSLQDKIEVIIIINNYRNSNYLKHQGIHQWFPTKYSQPCHVRSNQLKLRSTSYDKIEFISNYRSFLTEHHGKQFEQFVLALLGDNSSFEEEPPCTRRSLALEYQVPERLASNNRPYREIDQNKPTGRCTLNNVVTNLLIPRWTAPPRRIESEVRSKHTRTS